MRNKILGFLCALATMIAAMFVVSVVVPDGGSGGENCPVPGLALGIAFIISTFFLFIIVLPQALLARFIIRRFTCHSLVPYFIFILISTILFAPIALLYDEGSRLYGMLLSVGTLFSGCSVLWFICFRHKTVAQPSAKANAVGDP